MASFSRGTSFTDGVTGDVTAAKLHALVDAATPVAGLVTDRTAETSVASGDLVLISDASDSNALKKMTVTNLFKTNVSITSGTGTAGTVAIGPTGDTDTGLFFPGANTIAFSEGGTEAMRIDSSGDVIITSNKALVSRGAGGITTNSAVGGAALQDNTTGSRNTANGVYALYSNTTGYYNTANGYQALFSNTTGIFNTANGYNALLSNTTGGSNTANGRNALETNSTGHSNTANGYDALTSNDTGYYNTANGAAALYSNSTGHSNTASGVSALYSNTGGNKNTAIGVAAGYGTGSNSNTTGSNNTFIGNEAVGTSSTASNTVVLGNGAITHLRCQVSTISSLSDRRDKKDIAPLAAGLDFVSRLRPVSFVWHTRDKAKVGIPDAGFIAQELLEVQEQTGITIPYLVSQDNPDKLEAGIGTLIPVLVQAIRELKAKVESLEEKLK